MKINRRGFLGALATFVAAPFIPIPKPKPVTVTVINPEAKPYGGNPVDEIERAMQQIRSHVPRLQPDTLWVDQRTFDRLRRACDERVFVL